MPKKTKETRINEELQRLQAKYELMDGNQRTIMAPLLQNAAFMKITLDDLQEVINADGVVDTYQNGANQYGQKPSATLQSYNALLKNYTAVIKLLSSLVPYEKTDYHRATDLEAITPEEEAASKLEEEARRREEVALAIEYQRQEREYTGPKSSWPSFAKWKADRGVKLS